MKLLTKEILAKFAKIGRQETNDPIIVCKFFACGAYTFFATEYDPEARIFFGYTTLGYGYELGYTSLDDLESYRGPLGLGIERDLYYRSKKASEQHELTNYFLKNFA